MFRIYRDTRFSSDKSPYKTQRGRAIRPSRAAEGPDGAHVLPPPRTGRLVRWRWHLPSGPAGPHSHSPRDRRRREGLAGREDGSASRSQGDSLTRVPAGFDAAHPFADDLRRKDLYVLRPFSQRDVCSRDFIDRYVEACAEVEPLVAFLARALGLKA